MSNEKPKKLLQSFKDSIIHVLLVTAFIIVVGGYVGQLLIMQLVSRMDPNGFWSFVTMQYGSMVFLYLISMAWLAIFHKDLFIMALPKITKKTAKYWVIGLVVGLVMNGLCGIAALCSGSLSLVAGEMTVLTVIVAFIFIAFQCMTEEVISRVYMYNQICKRHMPFTAMLIGAAVFAALHLTNNGVTPIAVTNCILISILFCLSVYYLGNPFMAYMLHTAWNFCQNFILGLPNSGIESKFALLKISGEPHDSFFYNATFGVEASAFATVVLCVGIVLFILIASKRTGKSLKGMFEKNRAEA